MSGFLLCSMAAAFPCYLLNVCPASPRPNNFNKSIFFQQQQTTKYSVSNNNHQHVHNNRSSSCGKATTTVMMMMMMMTMTMVAMMMMMIARLDHSSFAHKQSVYSDSIPVRRWNQPPIARRASPLVPRFLLCSTVVDFSFYLPGVSVACPWPDYFNSCDFAF